MNNKSELNTILSKEGYLIQKKDTDNKTLIDIKNE